MSLKYITFFGIKTPIGVLFQSELILEHYFIPVENWMECSSMPLCTSY